jgi:hypothetical protein
VPLSTPDSAPVAEAKRTGALPLPLSLLGKTPKDDERSLLCMTLCDGVGDERGLICEIIFGFEGGDDEAVGRTFDVIELFLG